MSRNYLTLFLLTIVASSSLVSCYRMPREDEFSVVPSINNPDVTREKPSSGFTPNMGF